MGASWSSIGVRRCHRRSPFALALSVALALTVGAWFGNTAQAQLDALSTATSDTTEEVAP